MLPNSMVGPDRSAVLNVGDFNADVKTLHGRSLGLIGNHDRCLLCQHG